MLRLSAFFDKGQTEYYLLVLVFLALLVAAYLWGSRRRDKKTAADELENRFRNLERAELDALADEELVGAVVANLMAKLDKRRPDPYRVIPLLSRGRCAVYSVWLVCHEVESRGFAALYAGGAGGFVELAADALELMGAADCAEAARRTYEPAPGDEETEGPDLPALTEAFRQAAAREQPLQACIAYIRENPSEFVDGEQDGALPPLDVSADGE